MRLDSLFIENNQEIPFTARRRCWPPRAYFHFQDVIINHEHAKLFRESGILVAEYWGEYHNGFHISEYQKQLRTDVNDWEIVKF